jgi:hypothetical protein
LRLTLLPLTYSQILIFQLELKDASQHLSDLPTGSLAIMKSQRVKEVEVYLSLSANHKMVLLEHKLPSPLPRRHRPQKLQVIVLRETELVPETLENS